MWYNPIMRALLRSPLHFLVSGGLMLLGYTGRRSGKAYTTPVNYLELKDGLYILSTRERVWWRNLRGGAQVRLRLRGKETTARAQSIEDPEQVAAGLGRMLAKTPRLARYLNVRISPQGAPDVQDLAGLAREKVLVRAVLQTAPQSTRLDPDGAAAAAGAAGLEGGGSC